MAWIYDDYISTLETRYNMTNKEKVAFRKLRRERYDAMSIDGKIEVTEFAYKFSDDFNSKKIHIEKIIKLMIDKIRKRHC